jgi:hypothetical protein
MLNICGDYLEFWCAVRASHASRTHTSLNNVRVVCVFLAYSLESRVRNTFSSYLKQAVQTAPTVT